MKDCMNTLSWAGRYASFMQRVSILTAIYPTSSKDKVKYNVIIISCISIVTYITK